MVKKEIELLEHQIEKLSASNFDFEAWKKYSVLILARIFGSTDEKIKQLEKIDFEFNSWSLRDASGNESYEEGSKKLAKEVIKSAIDELRIYGLPISKKSDENEPTKKLINIILDEFKGSQVKELTRILSSRESKTEKKRRVKELIEEIGEYGCYDIITNILTQSGVSKVVRE
ncbi:MAG: hypothetical protein QM503_05825 [Bacteroidota bacterium]